MALLHAHSGEAGDWLSEIFLDGLLDTLKLLPFLFLTYLLMEFIEHRASDKAAAFMKRAGALSPLVGGAVGAVPQCGFSASASGLYSGRVITLGTLMAVFLSTSDEMLPILISGNIKPLSVFLIVLYKAVVGILVGFSVDLASRFLNRDKPEINIDEICENDNCHCERGIFYSALHHTLTVSAFVLVITLLINALVFFVGADIVGDAINGLPVLSHLLSAMLGLIPNCAVSVALATLYADGLISVGTMLAGLFSGAGVGLLVLYKQNKHIKENLLVTLILVVAGFAFGLLGDLIFPIVLK